MSKDKLCDWKCTNLRLITNPTECYKYGVLTSNFAEGKIYRHKNCILDKTLEKVRGNK